jgi:glycosyltransferase involved in cell wall biosynthesis
MKVAVLIPTRGDRPRFLENCLRMINNQTRKPDHVLVVDDAPVNSSKDITWRYRIGYDRLRGQNFDVIALIEDDDWYSPQYLEKMLLTWENAGRPHLFGTTYTIYYHIGVLGYFTMNHHQRSSAMNTLIKPDLNFKWCPDDEPFTDLHLWKTIPGKLFTPEQLIGMGIKHGVGLCGGNSHSDRLHRYEKKYVGTPDPNREFLRSVVDEKSYSFYENYFLEEKSLT